MGHEDPATKGNMTFYGHEKGKPFGTLLELQDETVTLYLNKGQEHGPLRLKIWHDGSFIEVSTTTGNLNEHGEQIWDFQGYLLPNDHINRGL
jgi:hypothetical protein